MTSKLTPEEVERIRPAFNSNGRPGILQSIVLAQREKAAQITIDLLQLKATYSKLKCVGVLKLIEYLIFDGKELQQIGSGSIDLAGVTRGPFTLEAARSLQEIYIGDPRSGLSPLQWLAYLAEGLPEVLPEQIKAFDEICGFLAKVHTLPSRPMTTSDL